MSRLIEYLIVEEKAPVWYENMIEKIEKKVGAFDSIIDTELEEIHFDFKKEDDAKKAAYRIKEALVKHGHEEVSCVLSKLNAPNIYTIVASMSRESAANRQKKFPPDQRIKL